MQETRYMRGETYGAATQFGPCAVVVFIVCFGAVSEHGRDVREHGPWAMVLIRVDEDSKAFEIVFMAEDLAGCCAAFGYPYGHAIAVEVALAMNLEFDLNLYRA